MQTNGLVDLFVNLFAALNVMRCIPAPYPLVLQVSIQTFCEGLIFGRVADETRIKVKGRTSQGLHIVDEGIRDARAAEESFGNVAFGPVDGVNIDIGWSV